MRTKKAKYVAMALSSLFIAAPAFAGDTAGNGTGTAATLNLNVNVNEAIDFAGDWDYYRIQTPQAGILTVGSAGSTDTYGILKSPTGQDLAANDDSNGSLNFQIRSNVEAGAVRYVAVRHYSGFGTGAYTIRATLTPVSSKATGDAGSSRATAMDLALNSIRNAAIDVPGDFDYYRLQITQAGRLTVRSTGATDTYGSLLNSSGSLLVSNDDTNGINFQVSREVSPGTYYVSVRHYSAYGTGSYAITASLTPSNAYSLYPLANGLSMPVDRVRLVNNFGNQAFGKTHLGVDIMSPSGSSVYSLGDGVVRRNKTNQNRGSAYLNYWNSVLIVYYPGINRYVYYGHMTSALADGATVRRNQLLGTLRPSYNDSNVRTSGNDHLHLGVSSRLVEAGWGYTDPNISVSSLQASGWFDPVPFMRGQ